MNKWALRILALIMLLAFILVMMNLQKQLLMLQRSRPPATTTR